MPLLAPKSSPPNPANVPSALPRTHFHCQPCAFTTGTTFPKCFELLSGFHPSFPLCAPLPWCCGTWFLLPHRRGVLSQLLYPIPAGARDFYFFFFFPPLLLFEADWNKTQGNLSIWRPGKPVCFFCMRDVRRYLMLRTGQIPSQAQECSAAICERTKMTPFY